MSAFAVTASLAAGERTPLWVPSGFVADGAITGDHKGRRYVPRGQCGRRFMKVIRTGALILLVPLVLICAASTPPAQAQAPSAAQLAAMKAEYRRPAARPVDNPALVDLGRHLFWDPRASASGKTACVTCHYPYLGWAVTDPRSRNDSGKLTSRKSQPLIGIGHATGAPYGWDGRSATLEAQVKGSIATSSMSMRETDAPVKVEVIEQRIRDVPDYVAKFKAALPGAPITLDTIAQAIAAYERTFEPGIAPFDRWIDGDEGAISESAKRGFVLFNTKTTCFACHTGWRFTDDKFHDISTTTTDLGRGRDVKDDAMMRHAFKTPTLRSVALRPPYMHNASQATLYDVVKHYEKEPIDRPSRAPLFVAVALSEQERLDLVAFMQTLTGVPEAEKAPKLP
jgi:cytochrome c peroxidase